MAVEIKVPSVGESITEVTVVKWLKNDGTWVERDEVIAELESDAVQLRAAIQGTPNRSARGRAGVESWSRAHRQTHSAWRRSFYQYRARGCTR